MSKSSQIYSKIFTKTFDKQLKKIRDPIRVNRINEKVDEIVESPYRNIDYGVGIYRGKRKERTGDDRIMFTICEQCRRGGHKMYNLCENCGDTPDTMITFWEIVEGHKYRK